MFKFFESINRFFVTVGTYRAAAELYRQGYIANSEEYKAYVNENLKDWV